MQFTFRILWDLMGFVINKGETKTFFEIRNGKCYKEVNANRLNIIANSNKLIAMHLLS